MEKKRKFIVKSPSGKKYKVTVPDGKTKEDAIRFVQEQIEQGIQPGDATAGTEDSEAPLASGDMAWGDVGAQALSNAPESTQRMFKDTWEAITHPIKTAKSLYGLGKGIIEIAREGDQGADEQQARAVGKFFSDRYFGMENLKRTLAKDPAGFLADASMLLTGGGAAVARIPGTVGKVGKFTSKYAQRLDPIDIGVRTAIGATKGAGKGVAAATGVLTGTGGSPIKEAFKAGTRGTPFLSNDFTRNLRAGENLEGVVADSLSSLAKKAEEGGKLYQKGQKLWKRTQTPLDIEPVILQYEKLKGELTEGGFSLIGKDQLDVVADIDNVLAEFLDSGLKHNAEGFDALKKRLDNVTVDFDKQRLAGKLLANTRKSVVKAISDKVPDYAQAMEQTQKALTEVEHLRKEFSLGRHNTPSQILRKLQGAMRANATTGFGFKEKMLGKLDPTGKLQQKLAGQLLNPLAPHGIVRGVGAGTVGLGGLYGAASGLLNPAWLSFMGLQSPRIAGELAYKAGQFAGAGGALPKIGGLLKMTKPKASLATHGLFQAGRQERVKKKKQTKGKIKRKGK